MFINFTNHPSGAWSDDQLAAARHYGEIFDLPFPTVESEATEEDIEAIAVAFFREICRIIQEAEKTSTSGEPHAVHVMGEMTLTYAVVRLLKEAGITCVASTTRREVSTLPDGSKVSTFRFVRLRRYE